MSFKELKCEVDQQKDAESNKDTNDTSQNQNAKKEPTEKADFLKMTPEQQQAAKAGHDKCTQLSAQGETASRQSQAEAAGALSKAMQSDIGWV